MTSLSTGWQNRLNCFHFSDGETEAQGIQNPDHALPGEGSASDPGLLAPVPGLGEAECVRYTAVAEPGAQQMPQGTYQGRRVIVQGPLAGGWARGRSCGHQFRAGLSGSAFSPGKQAECCCPSQGCGGRT